ncbi:MAG: hypothetical protein ACI8UO_003719 [Verrucomicrobiales bacterium]|jgi:hypothetical protein
MNTRNRLLTLASSIISATLIVATSSAIAQDSAFIPPPIQFRGGNETLRVLSESDLPSEMDANLKLLLIKGIQRGGEGNGGQQLTRTLIETLHRPRNRPIRDVRFNFIWPRKANPGDRLQWNGASKNSGEVIALTSPTELIEFYNSTIERYPNCYFLTSEEAAKRTDVSWSFE